MRMFNNLGISGCESTVTEYHAAYTQIYILVQIKYDYIVIFYLLL